MDLAESPRQALDAMGKTSYDIILLDIRMPGMSGVELFEEISSKWPAISSRVIFITGDVSDNSLREYLKERKIPFLTKPFDRTLLERQIDSLR